MILFDNGVSTVIVGAIRITAFNGAPYHFKAFHCISDLAASRHFTLSKEITMQHNERAFTAFIRKKFIEQLKRSKINDVSLDKYVETAKWIFELANTQHFHFLPKDLHSIVTNQKYPLIQYRAEAEYISVLMLDIKNGVPSKKSAGVPVACPCCGDFCTLTASHYNTERNYKWVYYCERCEYSVNAHAGDLWPAGVPASVEIRKLRSELTLEVEHTARRLGMSKRTVLHKVSHKLKLFTPVANICNVGCRKQYNDFDMTLKSL